MNLVEVLVAGLITLGSAMGSMQVWAASASGLMAADARGTALERSENDRVVLQAQWRASIPAGTDCTQAASTMAAVTSQAPMPAGLQRDALLNANEGTITLHWQPTNAGPKALERTRVISAAGLGVCESRAEQGA